MIKISLIIILLIIICKCSSSNKLALGDDAYVTLYVSPLLWSVGKYQRVVSKVSVDDIGSVNIKGSWTSAAYTTDTLINSYDPSWYLHWNDTTATSATIGLGVAIECNGVISYQQGYRVIQNTMSSDNTVVTSKTSVTFPILMAIITVSNGEVTSIAWDQECLWCSSECSKNTYDYQGSVTFSLGSACYVLDTDCTTSDGQYKKLCQLNVYITWAGTDKNGEDLKTASSRFSRISSTQLKEYTSKLDSIQNSDSSHAFYS